VLQDQRWPGSGQHRDGGFGADLAPCGRFEQDVEDDLQARFDHLVADERGQGVAGGPGRILEHLLQRHPDEPGVQAGHLLEADEQIVADPAGVGRVADRRQGVAHRVGDEAGLAAPPSRGCGS